MAAHPCEVAPVSPVCRCLHNLAELAVSRYQMHIVVRSMQLGCTVNTTSPVNEHPPGYVHQGVQAYCLHHCRPPSLLLLLLLLSSSCASDRERQVAPHEAGRGVSHVTIVFQCLQPLHSELQLPPLSR